MQGSLRPLQCSERSRLLGTNLEEIDLRVHCVSNFDKHVHVWTGAGQTVLGQKGTCRNRADGKSPAGFGQMENGSKRLSPFDTTLCRSQSGGQSINFDFPT